MRRSASMATDGFLWITGVQPLQLANATAPHAQNLLQMETSCDQANGRIR